MNPSGDATKTREEQKSVVEPNCVAVNKTGGYSPNLENRQDTLSSRTSSSAIICRICLQEDEGAGGGRLISPCLCSGTIQFVHQKCLLFWISATSNKKCELCNFRFSMARKGMKPISQWKRINLSNFEWLHTLVVLLSSFIVLGSFVWMMWSGTSQHPIARAERSSEATLISFIIYAVVDTGLVAIIFFELKFAVWKILLRWKTMNERISVLDYDKSTATPCKCSQINMTSVKIVTVDPHVDSNQNRWQDIETIV